MNRSNFGRAIYYHLTAKDLNQVDLAKLTGLSQASISRVISRERRPDVPSLRALCNCWPDRESNLRVLIEHLRDEVRRAGHDGETDVEFRPRGRPASAVQADIAVVASHAEHDAVVAELVHDLATLLRRAFDGTGAEALPFPTAKHPRAVAAEDPRGRYRAGGKEKGK
jgi:transcriptional regulator with XRE-family HTH domain